jgi:hypothetical protein
MSEVIQENWVYIATAYIAFFAFLLYRAVFANRGKIKVRVKTPSKEWVKWCKPLDDGETIVVEKAKAKKAGWSFKFTNKSLVPFRSWGRQMFAIDVFYHAPKAIEYDFTQDTATAPKLTKDQVKEFATWEALKARYAKIAGAKFPTWFMVLVVVLLIVNIILQLLSSGRIRIG